jgi:hypothetical protein
MTVEEMKTALDDIEYRLGEMEADLENDEYVSLLLEHGRIHSELLEEIYGAD